MSDQNNAPEMPDRIWAVSWFSRPDAGIWQENEPGSDQNAVEFIRADRAAPEGQCYFGPIGTPHWSSALTPPPAAPTDNTALVERHANKQRNVIINRCSTDLETIINGHDPEIGNLNNDVWDRLDKMAVEIEAALASREAPPAAQEPVAFQARVAPWMDACFGPAISGDRLERGDRLLEEVLELLQSGGYPHDRIAALTGYVWSRPAGEPAQEVGGVMVTLAAYCLAHDLDMHDAGETELARIWTKVEKIRAKQAAKPTGSALPQAWPDAAPPPACQQEAVTVAEAVDLIEGDLTGSEWKRACHAFVKDALRALKGDQK